MRPGNNGGTGNFAHGRLTDDSGVEGKGNHDDLLVRTRSPLFIVLLVFVAWLTISQRTRQEYEEKTTGALIILKKRRRVSNAHICLAHDNGAHTFSRSSQLTLLFTPISPPFFFFIC